MREVLMNEKTNLLQLEEHFYQLVDVDEPNTFRNLFPYSEVPKIAFNDRIVPHNMPEDIWITDTTFRDGQQSRAPYTTEQIVTIYDYLHKLGGPKGIIRQSEFFLYSKKDLVTGVLFFSCTLLYITNATANTISIMESTCEAAIPPNAFITSWSVLSPSMMNRPTP